MKGGKASEYRMEGTEVEAGEEKEGISGRKRSERRKRLEKNRRKERKERLEKKGRKKIRKRMKKKGKKYKGRERWENKGTPGCRQREEKT